MTTGDQMVYCALCGQSYWPTTGHACTYRITLPYGGAPWWNNTYQPMPSPGWQCPQCKRIYSPTTPECHACNSVIDLAAKPTDPISREWNTPEEDKAWKDL